MTAGGRDLFRSQIGASLGIPADRVTLFARGRVALYAILRALDVGRGDEVILPAFTCVAVPNAILYTGARPIYVDIDPASYTIDPSRSRRRSLTHDRVILAQNTFGLSADLDALEAIAARHGVTVVDDCAHGMGGRYGGQPNGCTGVALVLLDAVEQADLDWPWRSRRRQRRRCGGSASRSRGAGCRTVPAPGARAAVPGSRPGDRRPGQDLSRGPDGLPGYQPARAAAGVVRW